MASFNYIITTPNISKHTSGYKPILYNVLNCVSTGLQTAAIIPSPSYFRLAHIADQTTTTLNPALDTNRRMASKLIAIVAGVGPGTGASVARKFAKTYPVVLLARKPENFESLADEINKSGGKAIGVSTDVSSQDSLKNAISAIKKEFGDDVGAAAAIFNASGGFLRKPFLEIDPSVFEQSLGVSALGGILFSQAVLPLLLKGKEVGSQHPPTLIFTGATASVKSSAQLASFSTGKWALRALSQSLAKEFGPQGIHVAHAIIDGVIDIPRTREWLKDLGPEAKLSADGVSDVTGFKRKQANDNNRLRMTIGICIRSRRPTLHGSWTRGPRSRSGKRITAVRAWRARQLEPRLNNNKRTLC